MGQKITEWKDIIQSGNTDNKVAVVVGRAHFAAMKLLTSFNFR
jgi:hypothetical protein